MKWCVVTQYSIKYKNGSISYVTIVLQKLKNFINFEITVLSTGNKFIILNIFEHLDARIRIYTVSMLLMNVHLWIYFGITYPKDTRRRTFDAAWKNILFLFIQEYRLEIHIFLNMQNLRISISYFKCIICIIYMS